MMKKILLSLFTLICMFNLSISAQDEETLSKKEQDKLKKQAAEEKAEAKEQQKIRNENADFQEKMDKLWVMYIDEKYEQMLTKAEMYTENDNTRKEPMPYLFMAMASFEMSKDEKYDEDFPKAFRTALKFAAKYRKKDKDGIYVKDNHEFIAELREAAMEVAENHVESGEYSKAKGYYKYMTDFDPDCQASWLMLGYCEVKMNDFSSAKSSLANLKIKDVEEYEDLSEEQQRLLKYGLIIYSEYLIQNGNRDSAQATIRIGEPFFADDKEYQIALEDINR